jgi:Predicted Fe-S protein
VLDAERTCAGCRRTLDEIARWGQMSATEQWQVIARLERVRAQEEAAAAAATTAAR